MATTLAQLRAKVRLELRDPDGVTHTDEDVDYAIGQAYPKVFAEITNLCESYFVTVVNHDIVSGEREVALPADHTRTKRLEVSIGESWYPLQQRIRGITPEYSNITSDAVSYSNIYNYDFEANNIILEPTPRTDLTDGLRHTYYPSPIALSADDDEINAGFKDEWVSVIVLEATRACLSMIEATGGYVSAANLNKRLDELRESMVKTLSVRTQSPRRRRSGGFFE